MNLITALPLTEDVHDDDSEALFAAALDGAALCTVVRIDGSWSRRLGAQLAVLPDGSTRGSLADGCLERALVSEALAGGPACVLRYGQGSPFIDIRLPCGSGVELLVEPAPDRAALGKVCAALARREPAELRLSDGEGLDFTRSYLPRLRLLALGSGPELAALVALARAQRIELTVGAPSDEAADATLALGRAPDCPVDRWTAIALLFHDHEWEQALVPWALATDAFYVGAQGGRAARESRLADLAARGFGETELSRLRSPIGLFPAARTPSALALSVLAEIVAEYEALLG